MGRYIVPVIVQVDELVTANTQEEAEQTAEDRVMERLNNSTAQFGEIDSTGIIGGLGPATVEID